MGPQEVLIVQILAVQRVRQTQHQRDIGIGADRPPVGIEKIGDVVPHRADADHLDAGVAPALKLARAEWSPMPPWLICVFFIEMPPKLTTRRVCSSTSSMVGASFISLRTPRRAHGG